MSKHGDNFTSSKAELRRKVALRVEGPRPVQTHSVFLGKFRVPGYVDGDVIRALVDGEVLSRRNKKGWDQTVKAVTIKRGKYDDVRPVGVAVDVHLDKGVYY